MIIQAAHSPAVHWRRPLASTESAPLDRVELGSTVNPWSKLDQAGALTGASSLGGSIGSIVSHTVRQELVRALERIQAAGARIETRRENILGLLSPYEQLTPEKVADFALQQPPEKLLKLELTMPGVTERRPIRTLKDLQVADAVLGASVLPPAEQAQLDALRTLDPGATPSGTFEHLRGIQTGWDVSLSGQKGVLVNSGNVLGLDFLIGSGLDRGMLDLEFAQSLKAAELQGFSFTGDRAPLDIGKAYATDLKGAWVRQNGGVMTRVTRDDLKDLGALSERLSELEAVYQEVLIEPRTAMGFTCETACFPPVVLYGAKKFTLRESAAAYATVLRGALNADESSDELPERVAGLCRLLYAECLTPSELARKATLVGASYAGHGFEMAEAVWNSSQDTIAMRSGSTRERKDAIEELYAAMVEATGRTQSAAEGLDLVRIRVGRESQAERTRLFQEIAGNLPAESQGKTPLYYRTILAERPADEALPVIGARFCKLLQGLSAAGHQDRILEAFILVQQAQPESGVADRRVTELLKNIVIHKDVDLALAAGLDGGGASLGGVVQSENAVTIGGVRLARRGS